MTARTLNVDFCREDDGRWIAEVLEVLGAIACGATREEAAFRAAAVAAEVLSPEPVLFTSPSGPVEPARR